VIHYCEITSFNEIAEKYRDPNIQRLQSLRICSKNDSRVKREEMRKYYANSMRNLN